MVAVAVGLFTESGYEATTMDDIAAAAGMSRRSLFRHFGSKEDILFAEHDDLFETIERFLEAAPDDEPAATVRSAARMVFQAYVRSPAVTVPRFRLVRAVPRLRDREIAMTARYQTAFSRFLTRGETAGPRALAGEALAASVIAAHNHVLRSWLHAPEEPVPWRRFDEAMAFVSDSLGALLSDPGAAVAGPGAGVDSGAGAATAPAEGGGRGGESVLVAVYGAEVSGEDVLARVRAALEPGER
ncbi:TetR family transcriptional regulator [Streptomonospora sediminis]